MNPVTAVVVGAGDRGRHVYGNYALEHPGELRITAVAEPDEVRRREFSELHGIPPERSFAGYEELFAAPRLADAALICTQDGMHYRPALLAKQAGYHVLLEKPISNTPEECVRIWKDCAQNTAEGQIFAVCHVLRYTPFFLQIKKLLDEGAVGRLVNLQYEEDIGFYHFAHSYVRGNWRDESRSSPLVLAKSCHDLDILRWLAGSPVQHISSTGSLVEFTPANRPAGAPDRCAEGCPAAQTCPYNAVRLYHGFLPGAFLRPIVELEDATHDLDHALLHTGYGRCVYACGNNVPDHQAVSLHFENGVDAQHHPHRAPHGHQGRDPGGPGKKPDHPHGFCLHEKDPDPPGRARRGPSRRRPGPHGQLCGRRGRRQRPAHRPGPISGEPSHGVCRRKGAAGTHGGGF